MLTIARSVSALGIVGLCILSLLYRNYLIGRPPGWMEPSSIPASAYLLSLLTFLACGGILVRKKAAWSAVGLAALFFFFSCLRYIIYYNGDWLNFTKALALFGGMLILTDSYAAERSGDTPHFLLDKRVSNGLLYSGMLLLAIFFIAAGYAHFKFGEFVAELIPQYIPFRVFFAYFCGVCLIAGAIGFFIPVLNKWAALLSGIMIAGWFFLFHIPRFVSDITNDSDRLGLAESFAFAGICFLLYTTFNARQGSHSSMK